MAHIDDYSDYVDDEEQAQREQLKLHERVTLNEGDIRFLDDEQAELWQRILDQQAHIDNLESRIDDLEDRVNHHHERHERSSMNILELGCDLAELKDGNGGWAVRICDDEESEPEDNECDCWNTIDADCAADELGHCLDGGSQ